MSIGVCMLNQEKLKSMSKRNCVACINERNGVKTRISIPHSCGRVNVISIGRDIGKKQSLDQLVKHIEIAQKMRRAYEAVKGLYREEYQDVLKPHIEAIKSRMKEKRISDMEACLELSQECAEVEPNRVMFLIAGMVEITEQNI